MNDLRKNQSTKFFVCFVQLSLLFNCFMHFVPADIMERSDDQDRTNFKDSLVRIVTYLKEKESNLDS